MLASVGSPAAPSNARMEKQRGCFRVDCPTWNRRFARKAEADKLCILAAGAARTHEVAQRNNMKQYLAVSVLGKERPDLLRDITRAVLDSGCQIKDSRMTYLGEQFALLLLAGGSWNTIARLEGMLPRLAESLEVAVTTRRSHEKPARHDLIPYAIDAIAADQAGIVHNLAEFFISRKIQISELSTRAYPAPQTGAPLFSIQMAVAIPIDMPIAGLREDFMDLCDRINLDAIIEPMKN